VCLYLAKNSAAKNALSVLPSEGIVKQISLSGKELSKELNIGLSELQQKYLWNLKLLLTMPKIPDCDGRKANRLRHRCLYYTNNHHLLCAAHPYGPDGDTCIDFSPNPELQQGKRFTDFLGLLQRNVEYLDSSESFSNPFDLEPDEELWEPEGASYYAGELILQPQERSTREEQLDLLDTHPMFTGRCPVCNQQFPRYDRPPVHWDCSCG
jgi:hypothetical protein